jgi:predicted DCC family thiol-disulfide oxidoreductase YuxK
MTNNSSQSRNLTVYFDGSCPLCRAEIGHYQRQNGADAICFRDVSAPESSGEPDLPREAAMARFHVRRSDGTLVSGAAGFVEVWKALPRWRWAARLAGLPGVLWLLEAGYRGFLPVRPYLSRLAGRLRRS